MNFNDMVNSMKGHKTNTDLPKSVRKDLDKDEYCAVCNEYLGPDKHSVNIYGEEMNLCTDCFNETAECWFCHERFFLDDGELNQMADGDDYLCETCYQALWSRGEEVRVLRRSMKKSSFKGCYIHVNGEEYAFTNVRDACDFVYAHIEEAMLAMKGTQKLRELFDYELGDNDGDINSDNDILYWAYDIADRMMEVADNMPHESLVDDDFGDIKIYTMEITDEVERQWFGQMDYTEHRM